MHADAADRHSLSTRQTVESAPPPCTRLPECSGVRRTGTRRHPHPPPPASVLPSSGVRATLWLRGCRCACHDEHAHCRVRDAIPSGSFAVLETVKRHAKTEGMLDAVLPNLRAVHMSRAAIALLFRVGPCPSRSRCPA
jgi:hypothetical protein